MGFEELDEVDVYILNVVGLYREGLTQNEVCRMCKEVAAKHTVVKRLRKLEDMGFILRVKPKRRGQRSVIKIAERGLRYHQILGRFEKLKEDFKKFCEKERLEAEEGRRDVGEVVEECVEALMLAINSVLCREILRKPEFPEPAENFLRGNAIETCRALLEEAFEELIKPLFKDKKILEIIKRKIEEKIEATETKLSEILKAKAQQPAR